MRTTSRNAVWGGLQQPLFFLAFVLLRSNPGICLPSVKGEEATTLHVVSRRHLFDTLLPFGPRLHHRSC